MTNAYKRRRLGHFLIWMAIDVAVAAALVVWADVTAWKALTVAVTWNVLGYLQGRRRERLEAAHG